MSLKIFHFPHLLAVVTLAAPAIARENPVERRGITVKSPEGDTFLNPQKLQESIRYADGAPTFKILAIHSSEPTEPVLDTPNSVGDLGDIQNVCFSAVGPWVPYGTSITATESASVGPRAMTCETKESIVKSLGFTAVFLKGTSYLCSFTPLPQAQVAAKVFDIASYASSSISLVVSMTHCENKMDAKFNALLKACEDLRTMGVDCRGVDDTPY